MGYFAARSDWRFIHDAIITVDEYFRTNHSNNNDDGVRDDVVRLLPRLKSIAHRCRTNKTLTKWPAPAVGGPVVTFELVDEIIQYQDHVSHAGIGSQRILDMLKQTEAVCQQHVKEEFWALFNPITYLKVIVSVPTLVMNLPGIKAENRAMKILTLVLNILWILTILTVLISRIIQTAR